MFFFTVWHILSILKKRQPPDYRLITVTLCSLYTDTRDWMDFKLSDFHENFVQALWQYLSGAHWPAHLCDVEKVALPTEDLSFKNSGL